MFAPFEDLELSPLESLFWRILRRVTDHRGFWGAFSLFCLSVGVGGYVSYTIANAYTSKPVIHLGYVPTVCLCLTILGALVFLALVAVFLHLWWVKRYVTKAMITCEVYFLRARLTKDLISDDEEIADVIGSVKQWKDNTMVWLSKHDRAAYARFINSSGFLEKQQQLTGSEIDRCLIELDIMLTRLLDISAAL